MFPRIYDQPTVEGPPLRKRTILAILFFIAIITVTPISRIQAYTSGIRSVDQFRNEYIDVYQLITINYTDIGTGGSAIAIIRSDGQLSSDVQANAITDLGSNARIEVRPEIRSVWRQTPSQVMQISYGDYTEENTTYLVKRTFENRTVAYLNYSNTFFNQTELLSTEQHTGYRYEATLLPPYDIAYYWCQENGAVLNSIDNVNLSVTQNRKLVDFIAVQYSEPMEPDLDLSDGYDGVPVSASFALTATFASLIWKLVIIIAGAICFLAVILTGWTPFDYSTNVDYNPDQSIDFDWGNSSEHWDTYESICGTTGTTPTMEGFLEYLKTISEMLPDAFSWNNDLNITGAEPGTSFLTGIVAFLTDLFPLIMMVIIIVALAFGGILIYRGLKMVSGVMPAAPKLKTRRK